MAKFRKVFSLKVISIWIGSCLLLNGTVYSTPTSQNGRFNLRPNLLTDEIYRSKDTDRLSSLIDSAAQSHNLNQPSLEDLESKIFAVHTTPILPEKGILKAGARDITSNREFEGNEPPSFRPTIHFSLGEVVREHGDFDWTENPYAVVAPLKSLEGQLVNVFPNDTFILGNFHLSEETTLWVPSGTDVSALPPGIPIVEYDPKVGLRTAVARLIQERGGWAIRMFPGGADIGSVAYIGNTEINSAEFFGALFEKLPHLSYGTHLDPERGDAFRFGIIEQTINALMKNYSDHWNRYSTVEVQFNSSLILHHLKRLEQSLQEQSLAPEVMRTFEEKRGKLSEWLNIVDVDLEIRKRLGKTLTGASDSIQKQVRRKRNYPEALRELVDTLSSVLPNAIEYADISPSVLAERLFPMSPDELREFISSNPEAFEHTDLLQFNAEYAVNRWLLVKSKRAREEGLDRMLDKTLQQVEAKPKEGRGEGIFKNLIRFLTVESNRLEIALAILREPVVRQHLADHYGIIFAEGGPQTLEDVISAHPETKEVFAPSELSLNQEQKIAYEFLKNIGQVHQPSLSKEQDFRSFQEASFLAFDIKWSTYILWESLDTVTKPMYSARDLDNIRVGDVLTLYERLRRNYKDAADIWKKVGLEQEFKQLFANEELFWQSELSLLEIYQILRRSRVRDSVSETIKDTHRNSREKFGGV